MTPTGWNSPGYVTDYQVPATDALKIMSGLWGALKTLPNSAWTEADLEMSEDGDAISLMFPDGTHYTLQITEG